MSIAFVQSFTKLSSAGSTTLTLTPGSAVAAGDALVIFAGNVNWTNVAITGITDTKGNTYGFLQEGDFTTGPHPVRQEIWGSNITTALTTSDTITVTFASSNWYALIAAEFSGASLLFDTIGRGGATINSGTPTGLAATGNMVTQSASALLVAGVTAALAGTVGDPFGAPTGWTKIAGIGNGVGGVGWMDAAYKIVSSAGTYGAAFSYSGGNSQPYVEVALAILPTSTPPSQWRIYLPENLDPTEHDGGWQNTYQMGLATPSSLGAFGLPADGPYDICITPDGLLGIVDEVQVNTTSTNGHAWVFSLSDLLGSTKVSLSAPGPRGMAIIPQQVSGHWCALVCSEGEWIGGHNANGTIDVVDMSASPPAVVKTISTSGVYPTFVAVTPDGHKAIVVDAGNTGNIANIYTIDLTAAVSSWAMTAGPTGSGAQSPNDLCISPDGSYAWIAMGDPTGIGPPYGVLPLNLSTMTLGSLITTAGAALSLAVSPDSSKLWVGLMLESEVQRIDTATKAVDQTKSFTPNGSTSLSNQVWGSFPITITPDGQTVYWTEGGTTGGHLHSMDTTALTPTDTGITLPGFGAYLSRVTPDQPPTAGFTLTTSGATVSIASDSSTASPGFKAITKWHVDWGDGNSNDYASSAAFTSATHTYGSAGTYTVTLTVTNAAGTSTSLVHDGIGVLRNGGSGATTTESATVTGPTTHGAFFGFF